MLDSDLAELYQVPTFRFNEAVKRNRRRFPKDFMFQLTKDEAEVLTSHFAMSKRGRGGRRTSPYGFTEHGVAMLSSVLNGERAVQIEYHHHTRLRQTAPDAGWQQGAGHRLEAVERSLKAHARAIAVVYDEVKKLPAPPHLQTADWVSDLDYWPAWGRFRQVLAWGRMKEDTSC